MEQKNILLEGIHYSSGKLIRVGISKGSISSITEVDQALPRVEANGSEFPVIAPGLVDMQINGYMGVDFNDPELSPDQIETASEALLSSGVCSYYPTLITGSKEKTSNLLKIFARAMAQNGMASQMIGGIHLEGPFISREDGPRGAHMEQYCLDPDLNLLKEWQEMSEGKIRFLTLAPELKGSEDLIRSAVGMGMVVGIGHTAASAENIQGAVNAGATLSTHLGNGCHNILPRHPNYIWDQLAENRLYASMIADGFHLPDAVLKVFIRSKGKKAILISDGMTYTGLKPGLYDSPATGRVELSPEGKLHLEGNPGTLAGSASTLLQGIKKIATLEGFPYAWEMGSVFPASLMNKTGKHGFQVGAPADLVLLHADTDKLEIRKIYKNGVLFNP